MDILHFNFEGRGIMLKRLTFQNSYSFKERVVFDLSVEMTTDTENPQPKDSELGEGIRYPGGRRGILPVAAIYGKNASGKTKLLQTLRDVVMDALGDSFVSASGLSSSSPYKQIINMRQFVMTENPENTIFYSICVVMKNATYHENKIQKYGAEYLLEYTIGPDGVEAEIMKRRGLGKNDSEIILYSRNKFSFEPGPDETINKYLGLMSDSKEKRLWFSQIAPAQEEGLSHLYEWFRYVRDGMTFNNSDRISQNKIFRDIAERIATNDNKDFHKKLLWLLQGLDSSVHNIRGITVNPDKDSHQLYIFHKIENSVKRRAHDIHDESAGTRQLIVQFPLIYRAFEDGLPFICDELDKMLHPIAFKRVVDWFSSPSATKDDTAQLIFTAHDTIALDSDCLRRDEVHIVEKSENSMSTIRRLSGIVPDPYPNMEREFRLGQYGSTPNSFPYDYRMVGDKGAKG